MTFDISNDCYILEQCISLENTDQLPDVNQYVQMINPTSISNTSVKSVQDIILLFRYASSDITPIF